MTRRTIWYTECLPYPGIVLSAKHPLPHSVTKKDTLSIARSYILLPTGVVFWKLYLTRWIFPPLKNQTGYSKEMKTWKRFLGEGRSSLFSSLSQDSIFLSEKSLPRWGLGRAPKCSGAHAQLIPRYISPQPYWLPCPFDQTRRGFYYLKRLTAWARWQVCHEENNNQKQMHGIFTNMSATTVHVSSAHPHQEKKK